MDGRIDVRPDLLHVTANLGFLLSAMRGPIEAEIRRSLFPTLWMCRAFLPAMVAAGATTGYSSLNPIPSMRMVMTVAATITAALNKQCSNRIRHPRRKATSIASIPKNMVAPMRP